MQFRNKESDAKERIATSTSVGSGYLRSSAAASTSAARLPQVNALHVQRTTRPRRRDWRGFLVLATSARLVIRRLESQPPQRTVRHASTVAAAFIRFNSYPSHAAFLHTSSAKNHPQQAPAAVPQIVPIAPQVSAPAVPPTPRPTQNPPTVPIGPTAVHGMATMVPAGIPNTQNPPTAPTVPKMNAPFTMQTCMCCCV